MITKITNGIILSDGEKMTGASVYFENGTITNISHDALPYDRLIDADGAFIAPGFIDMHVHGGGGAEFMDGGIEPIVQAGEMHLKHGTTALFPTSLSCSDETLRAFLSDLREARKTHPNLQGAHLEGPYFSPARSGAQKPEYIKVPEKAHYLPLLEEFGDVIARWDFAPELPGAQEFAKALAEHQIVASVGHSDATFSDVEKVYQCGTKLLTHFYNAMSTISKHNGFRALGVIECGYYFDDMDVEIISDSCHLPVELLRMITKQKSLEHIALVTDAMRGAGMPDGPTFLGKKGEELPCIIEDGVAKKLDRTGFAGSVATTDRLVRTMVNGAGLPIETAVMLATKTPARIMGLTSKGSLQEGKDADIVIFDKDVQMKHVFLAGKEIFL